MNYQPNYQPNYQTRQVLRSAVQGYLRSLSSGEVIHLAGEWNRSVYPAQFRKVMRTMCRARWYFNVNNNNNNNIENGGILRVEVPPAAWQAPQQNGNGNPAAALAAVANSAALPAHILPHLNALRGVVWVWVYIRWGGLPLGHATLLLFDPATRRQYYYDPHWGYDDNGGATISRALCQRRFHPAYEPAPLAECAPASIADSLQTLVQDEMDIDEHGVCGILCLLVVLCCTRVQYFDPLRVSQMMVPVLNQPPRMNEVISWYNGLIHTAANDVDAVIRRIFPNRPPRDPAERCAVYNPKTRRACSRRPCHLDGQPCGAFCWQHRFLITNTNGDSRACDAASTGCPAEGP